MKTHSQQPYKSWTVLFFRLQLLVSAAFPAFAAGQGNEPVFPVNSYVLRVDGLACPYCAYGIEKEFSHLKGTTNTEVNLQKGVVIVHVRSGTHWSKSKVNQTVEDAGFTLKRIVHKPEMIQ